MASGCSTISWALLGREHARQALGQARERDDRARIERPGADAAAVAHQRARRRQAPPARRRRQPGPLERACERLEIVGRRIVDLDVALAQEVAKLPEIAAVGGRDRVARRAALEREMREEIRDRVHGEPFARRRRYPPSMQVAA